MNKSLVPARLIRRKNRFVADVLIENSETEVYVPNTGRLSELAIPGAECLLAESTGKYRYKLLYIISAGFPVMIDSTLSNSLFAELLLSKKVPGLANYSLVKREPVFGNRRFDYLLHDGKKSCYAELKSCTLFYRDVASFPDAVSNRAAEHIRELSSTGNGRLIILVLNDSAKIFVPNYHTDYEFYETLKENRHAINISAFRVSYDDDLVIKYLTPVRIHIPDVKQTGFFIAVAACGNEFYIYMSGNTDNVFAAVKKFKTGAKTLQFFSGIAVDIRILKDFPVIDEAHSADQSLELFYKNGGVEQIIDTSSDGSIFRFSLNPLEQKWFHEHILCLRFSRYSPV